MIFFAWPTRNSRKKEKEKKKKKSFPVKPRRTIIHTPFKEEKITRQITSCGGSAITTTEVSRTRCPKLAERLTRWQVLYTHQHVFCFYWNKIDQDQSTITNKP
jgi:hypothetical protein